MQQLLIDLDSYLNIAASNYVVTALIAFLAILISQLLAWFIKKILNRLIIEAGKKRANRWNNIIIEAAIRPISLSIKVGGVLLALAVISTKIENDLFRTMAYNSYLVFIPIGSWFLTRVASLYERSYLIEATKKDEQPDITTVQAVSKLIRLSVIIITILIVLQNLGINITGLVAAGGVGGLAIGFAAQDLLANFFGGLMLYLEQPFKIGDWIRSPDREIEGTVTDVGLRTTVVRTFDHRPLYIPNSIFTKIVVENPSRMNNRRIYETVGVRYQDVAVIEPILHEIRDYLVKSADIDTNLTNMVNFNRFAPSSLDFFVYCFTATKDWAEFHNVKENLLLEISQIIVRHNAEIAFPTSTVHLQAHESCRNG